jgi:hypothetical protein
VRTHYDALARTMLLLNQELFSGEADERLIADALLETTVRFEADEGSLSSRAGQTALVTAFNLTARLGIGIELVAPNIPVIDLVAPLRLPGLVDALLELGDDLVPGARVRITPGEADETFAFGETGADAEAPVRVSASDFTADLLRAPEAESHGDLPLGGFAGGAALAAIALEVALPRMERATRLTARRPRPSPGPPVRIDLQELFPEFADGLMLDVGDLDAISGGAITHALLFCLLRMPGLRAHVRVVEEQHADVSNVNRYALLRGSDDGRLKTEQLETVATTDLGIVGVPTLFTKETRGTILPFADRVVVGVDDVEARWWVQEENPAWLAVGATGNHLAQLTTHVPEGPCAGCAHPVPLPPQTIPTISFVSFWAGLLQACALVCGTRPTSSNGVIYPFAFGGTSATGRFALAPRATCPIGCLASRNRR